MFQKMRKCAAIEFTLLTALLPGRSCNIPSFYIGHLSLFHCTSTNRGSVKGLNIHICTILLTIEKYPLSHVYPEEKLWKRTMHFQKNERLYLWKWAALHL